MAKSKENLEVTKEQEEAGVSIIDGQRCLHGFNSDEMDEMNKLNLNHEDMRKLLKSREK